MGAVHESGNYQGFDLENTDGTKVLQKRRVKLLYKAVAVHCVIKNVKKLHKLSKGQVHQNRLGVTSLFTGLPQAAHVYRFAWKILEVNLGLGIYFRSQ